MSAYFEETHIRQIQQAVDIVELIGGYVALKPAGREFLALCPFHDDSRPSMHVSPVKQIFKCFACGAGGDVIKFIMLRERMTFPEAVKLLAERANIQLPERRKDGPINSQGPQTELDRNYLEKLNRWAARFFRVQFEHENLGLDARNYVETRSISEQTARIYGIGFAPDSWDSMLNAAIADNISPEHLAVVGLLVRKDTGGYYDRFRNRLIFPVIDGLKRIIAFGGRTLGDDPAKYLNSPESVLFDKSRSLYGLHAASDAIVKQGSAIIVEGYTDCLMAHQMGVKNVVAALGTAFTTEHARILSRYTSVIVLMFDSDAAGQKAADRAIDIFAGQKVQVKLVSLPDGQDPCDYLVANGPEAFLAQIENAIDALEYKWNTLLSQLSSEDAIDGRRLALDQFLELIGRMASQGQMDPITQGLLFNNVARLVNLDPRGVHQRLEQIRKRQRQPAQGAVVNDGQLKLKKEDLLEKQMLEVLLNQPDLLKKVIEAKISPENFKVPQLKQVAQRLWQCCQNDSGITLSIILAGCPDQQLCNIMTDLAQSGADRGNNEQTLEGLLEALKSRFDNQARRQLAIGQSDVDDSMAQIQERLRDLHSRSKKKL
ncbi:MAG: DNA primase [Phycisphaerae bacterium]|nr:DNA primase [Phycisphaerae bacterium]